MGLTLKKRAGKIARKWLGKRFEPFRLFCRDVSKIPSDIHEIISISRRTFVARPESSPGEKCDDFYTRYYTDSESKHPSKRGVICMFDGKLLHGGLTDRIRGILSIYEMTRKKGLPFYIYWTRPFKLEKYLIPSTFDWRIGENELSHSNKDSYPIIIMQENNILSNIHNLLRFRAGTSLHLPQIHIYSNADNGNGHYRNLYDELFTPTPFLKSAVQKALSDIGSPYWAFSFRFLSLLGDFKDNTRRVLSEVESELLIADVVAEFRKLIRDVPEGYRILVTSDSERFALMMRTIDPRVYVVPGDVVHIDLTDKDLADTWLKTFLDQHLLMHAERVILMRTGDMYRSGFPCFAAEIGGAEFIDYKF